MSMKEALQKKATEAPKRGPGVSGSNSTPCSDPVANRVAVLQHTVGNGAVGRLCRSGFLQAKLRMGQPNDIYEQEADRVADQVMRMPDAAISHQRPAISRGNHRIQMKPG
jgi:hypothetical protein